MAYRVKFAVVGVGDFSQKRIKAIVRSDVAELLYVAEVDRGEGRDHGRGDRR